MVLDVDVEVRCAMQYFHLPNESERMENGRESIEAQLCQGWQDEGFCQDRTSANLLARLAEQKI